MHIERHTVAVTTAADGSATALSETITGTILAIHYVANDFASGVDFTVTGEATGETIWTEANVNASKSCAPRMATHGTDGTAALYAAAGTAVQDKIGLAADRVKIVIANGGATKSGTFHIVVG